MKDYYGLLGLEQKATKSDIKKNYRLLATKFHPDKNSDPKAAQIFIAITEAYDTLSNRKSRARYDLLRWQTIKNKQATDDSFRTVVPPRESTRSRKNRAQKNRSVRHHQAKSEGAMSLLLNLESLYILSRYILHVLVITLMAVVLRSAITQITAGFSSGIFLGVGISLFVGGLVFGIFKIAQNAFVEVKKDMAIFSIYYKISHLRAIGYTVPIFVFLMVFYFMVLLSY